MACLQREVVRLPAADGVTGSGSLVGTDFASLIVLNPLAAPVYVLFGAGVPSRTNYDLAVPGNSLMCYPIAGADHISAVVDYPGAVPADDIGQSAIFTASEATLGVSVGPLAS